MLQLLLRSTIDKINTSLSIHLVSFVFLTGLFSSCLSKPCHHNQIWGGEGEIDFDINKWGKEKYLNDIDTLFLREDMSCDLVYNVIKPLSFIDSVENLIGGVKRPKCLQSGDDVIYVVAIEHHLKPPLSFLCYQCGMSVSGAAELILVFNNKGQYVGFGRVPAN